MVMGFFLKSSIRKITSQTKKALPNEHIGSIKKRERERIALNK